MMEFTNTKYLILAHKLGNQNELAKLITKNNKEYFVYFGNDYLINTLKIIVFYSNNVNDILDKLGELNGI